MGIRIDKDEARARLAEAVEWATSASPVPVKWLQLTERMEEAPSKTYTPALGTALLAKATDPRVDALSIKDNYAENAYSQRGLCHSVLVPAAVAYGFSLRNTKREPLNNQPFFRYDHISLIDRVKADAVIYLEELRAALTELNACSSDEALAGLAAFLRVRFEHLPEMMPFEPSEEVDDVRILIERVTTFLNEPVDRAHRTQALVAAAFDMLYRRILTRGLNDPSRDFPGDVQAFIGSKPIMSAEVRAKPVPSTELRSFVTELRNAEIARGFLVVFHLAHEPLPRRQLTDWAWDEHRVVVTIIESPGELIWAAVRWSELAVVQVLNEFPVRVADRLVDIDAPPVSLERWRELFN